MSLATLARKTRTKKRMNTRGKFILNMTGRGNVLGMNAKMSRGNCGGKLTNCAGKRSACCVGVGGESDCCRFPHGGKPAPQMGYGVYLNRKSKGAYHPGGGKQCKDITGCTNAKTVWKQHSNLDASVVITNKKDNVLACNSDVYTAKRDTCTPDCSGQCCCPVKKNICGCRATDLVRYTRINKSFGCQTTKAVRMGRSASEQIARNRANVDCIKPMHRTIHITINATDISFDGCCGDQCLIPGQQYTFVFTLGTSETFAVSIEWCTGLTQILANRTWTTGDTFTISLTIPKFSSLPCLPATAATITGAPQSATATLDYCKQAFKKPQMLGSCSGN
ncbi:MAG: hypothetical protein CXT73_03100 [Methanobacteriota archaeon]|jgi:hypothetical protein|nr:MAG: hypothetical protein CXT73_03100 [Euryarchaeota archaeon]